MKKVALLVLFLLLPFGAIAIEIKGVSLGDNERSVMAAFPRASCSESVSGLADTVCFVLGDTIANTTANLGLYITNGKLWMFTADEIHPAHYSKLLTAFKTKYGEPSEMLQEDVTTNAGVNYVNDIAKWEIGGALIVLKKYDGSISEMGVSIHTIDGMLEAKKAIDQKNKEAASDL